MFRSMLLVGLVAFAALSLVSTADAARGGRKAQAVDPSIAIDQTDPHLGDTITFTYVVNDLVKSPRVQVVCSQAGAVVYAEAKPAGESFKLGADWSTWLTSGGEADCVATLYSWDFHPVQTFIEYASTPFHSAGAR